VSVLKEARGSVIIDMKITLPIAIAGNNAIANTFKREPIFLIAQAVKMRCPLVEQGTNSGCL